MELRTLGELVLFNNGQDVKLGSNELIILTHLLLEGPQERNVLAERIWYSKREELSEQGTKSLAQANLKSSLSRLRIQLRQLTRTDLLEESERSMLIALHESPFSCDYLEFLKALETPDSISLDKKMQDRLEQSFMAGIEFNSRLDIKNDFEHPLYLWINEKRQTLQEHIDRVFGSKRYLSIIKKQPLQSLLDKGVSSKQLNDLYIFCSSEDYPYDKRQQKSDLDKLIKYFNDQYEDDLIADVSSNLAILALVALSGDKLKSLYVDYALERFSELYTTHSNPFEQLGMLELLIEDGWLIERETLHSKYRQIIDGWLEKHPRIAAKLLEALLDSTPEDEEELITELYTNGLEIIKYLAKEKPEVLIKAAQQNLKRGLPDRAAELLNYGLQATLQTEQLDYAHLLLAYAYEQVGKFQDSIKAVDKLTKQESSLYEGADPRLPSTYQDGQMIKIYARLKAGLLNKKEIEDLEADPEPADVTWAEAKRFNIMGTYYMNHIGVNSEPEAFTKALNYFDYAKELWANFIANPDNLMSELNNIAICYAIAQDFDTAEGLFEANLKRADEVGASGLSLLRTRYNYASTVMNKAAELKEEDFQRALELYHECYKVPFIQHYEQFLLRVYFDQGILYQLHLKQLDEAISYYERARDLATKLGNKSFQGSAVASIGLLKKQKFLVDAGIKLIRESGDLSDLDLYLEERDKLWSKP